MSKDYIGDTVQQPGALRRRTVAAGSLLALLAEIAPGGAAEATGASEPPPAGSPGPLTGLRFTQTDPVHPAMGEGYLVGWADPVGGIGPYRFAIQDSLRDKYLIDPVSGVVRGRWTPFGITDDRIVLMVTDARGVTVKSAPIQVRKTGGEAPAIIMNARNPAHNCTVDTFFNGPLMWVQAAGGTHKRSDSVTVQNPDGSAQSVWRQEWGPVRYRRGTSIPTGTYKLLFSSKDATGDVLQLRRDIVILEAPPIAFIEFAAEIVSTSMRVGTLVGRLRATTPNNTPKWAIDDPTGTLQVNGVTGEVFAAKPFDEAGEFAFEAIVADNSASRRQRLPLAVRRGVTLPPEKMTLTNVNPHLDNATRASPRQHVGTIKVDGAFAGPVRYAISRQTRFNRAATTPAYGPRLVINDKGVVEAVATMSVGTDTFTVVATDGTTTCTNSFTVTTKACPVTTYFVGPGDPAAWGLPAGTRKLARLSDARRLCMAAHADTKVFKVDPNVPSDYFAGDTSAGGDYALRFAWMGPGVIEFLHPANGSERDSYYGGAPTNDRPGGGDMRGKGTLVLGEGDWTVIAAPMHNTHGRDSTHGLEAIRRDGETYGDTTLIGVEFLDNDQGFETGLSHGIGTLDRCEFNRNGTSHVSSGACHNIYVGAMDTLIMRRCTSTSATLGHLVKSRAKTTIVEDCVFFDGLVGSSSCLADIPNGGQLIFRRNKLEKGTMAMNPFALQYGAEGVLYEENTYLIEDNEFSLLTLAGSHAGPNAAIGIFEQNNHTGVRVTGTIRNNRFYASAQSGAKDRFAVFSNGAPCPHTGTDMLTAPPLLDLRRPYFKGAFPRPKPLYVHTLWGQDYYRNFEGVQQVPDRYEIVLPRSRAKPGQVLCTIYAHNDLGRGKPNAFGPGTQATLVRQDVYYKHLLPDPWAPDSRYALVTKPDGSADLVLAGELAEAAEVDYVQVRFTAPDGTLCDSRYPIKLTA